MEQPSTSGPSIAERARTQRFRAGAGVVILLGVAVILWLALRDTGSGGSSSKSANVSAASEQQLRHLAVSLGHPIYWLGPKAGWTYELTRSGNGSIIVRYLPPGVQVGDARPYLSVATYPFPGALGGIQSVRGANVVRFDIPNGGQAEYTKSYPESVHLAYPASDYQVEVYDPTPGNAKAIAVAGQVTALGHQGGAAAASAKPTAVSAAGLRAVAKSLGHPLYWIGPKNGDTYELTQANNGNVFIRYLPPGVQVGAPQAYLSVATYPFPGALAATRALGKQKSVETIVLANGGVAVIGKSYPQSVHIAYPGSNFQVELFDPSAAKARQIVSSGQVSAIG
jgi:hypothetical protein